MLKHLLRPEIDPLIKRFAMGVQSNAQDAETFKRRPALLPQIGHALARTEADLERAHCLGHVVAMDCYGRRRIKLLQHLVQILGTTLCLSFPQALPQCF